MHKVIKRMVIFFSKEFKKDYKKLPKKIQIQTKKRIWFFKKNKNNPVLNNHKLHGEYDGFCSINISGNIRAIYEDLGKDDFLFIKIGTHSQLY